MGRAPCCEKIGLKKGPWTAEEDEKLASYVKENGHGSWRALPKKAGLLRCGKSCRLRWTNYLRPDIKRGEFSASEEQTIIQLHALLGNRWSAIANHLPKRTDNEIKNYWNTHLKKRLLNLGLDPATHKPKAAESSASCGESRLTEPPNGSHGSSAISHMAQWESARLEAEARLAKESSLRAKGLWPFAAASSASLTKPASCAVMPKQKHSNAMPATQVIGGIRGSLLQKFEGGAASSGKDDSRGMSANEIINTIQNWEYSLQGQAGAMWPESWRSSSISKGVCAGIEPPQQESSGTCSSPPPQQQQLGHGSSPTSTLCFLEPSPRALNQSASRACKLSWSDILCQNQPARSCRSSQESGLPSLLLACMQDDATEFDSYDTTRPEEEKPQGESTTNSNSLLDELELVSEDSTSTKSSSMMSCEELGDHYWDNLLADCL